MIRNGAWTKRIAGLVVLGGLSLGVSRGGALRRALSPVEPWGFDERLSRVDPKGAPWLAAESGGVWGRTGWALSPGGEGVLRINIPIREGAAPRLLLWGSRVLGPTGLAHTLKGDLPVALGGMTGSPLLLPPGTIGLSLRAKNTSRRTELVLDRFLVSYADRLPSLPRLDVALVFVFLGIIVWARFFRGARGAPFWGLVGVLLVAVLGVHFRWEFCSVVRDVPLDPDALGYLEYGKKLEWFQLKTGFYSGSFYQREPLFPGILNLWFRVWGPTPNALRFFTVCSSAILLLAVPFFVWVFTKNPWMAVASAAGVAFNPEWIDLSVRGLRDETFPWFLLLGVGLWAWSAGKGWRGTLLTGSVVGLAALLRSEALVIFFPLFLIGFFWAAWKRSRGQVSSPDHRLGALLGMLLVTGILYAPHVMGLKRTHGSSRYSSELYARWIANCEFPDKFGTPGFPTREEFEKDSFAGPPLRFSEYIFRFHTVSTLIKGQVRGWMESSFYFFMSSIPQGRNTILAVVEGGRESLGTLPRVFILSVALLAMGVSAWGGWSFLKNPGLWWVPVLCFLSTWYAAYLYAARVLDPFRHTSHAAPFWMFCFLEGVRRTVEYIRHRRGRRASGIA